MTLTDLERLCEQATKGPWQTWCGLKRRVTDGELAANDDILIGTTDERMLMHLPEPPFEDDRAGDQRNADARFIVAAREWMPKLIAVAKAGQELRRLTGVMTMALRDDNEGRKDYLAELGRTEEAMDRALAQIENSGSLGGRT